LVSKRFETRIAIFWAQFRNLWMKFNRWRYDRC
jgi:hypothetical protein